MQIFFILVHHLVLATNTKEYLFLNNTFIGNSNKEMKEVFIASILYIFFSTDFLDDSKIYLNYYKDFVIQDKYNENINQSKKLIVDILLNYNIADKKKLYETKLEEYALNFNCIDSNEIEDSIVSTIKLFYHEVKIEKHSKVAIKKFIKQSIYLLMHLLYEEIAEDDEFYIRGIVFMRNFHKESYAPIKKYSKKCKNSTKRNKNDRKQKILYINNTLFEFAFSRFIYFIYDLNRQGKEITETYKYVRNIINCLKKNCESENDHVININDCLKKISIDIYLLKKSIINVYDEFYIIKIQEESVYSVLEFWFFNNTNINPIFCEEVKRLFMDLYYAIYELAINFLYVGLYTKRNLGFTSSDEDSECIFIFKK